MRITNCHTHTLTDAHVPRDLPSRWLTVFKWFPKLVRFLAWVARLIGPVGLSDALDRLYQFQTEAANTSQVDVFRNMCRQYPHGTRFVVLPLDMSDIGHGPVEKGIAAQHDELSALARSDKFAGQVIPFATVNPNDPETVEEFRRAIKDLRFRGLKLYPRLGYPPDHPVLMRDVYPVACEHDLPVMSHCSRGGVQGKHLPDYFADRYTEPAAFLPVMMEFPHLRVCLAHFGGPVDWRRYVHDGITPDAPAARRENWQVAIRDLIECGDWPGLWTDISYTLFHFDDNLPFLKLFLEGTDKAAERMRARLLFGSDFYMTRRERLSERAVCIRLRSALGEPLFQRLAETNPAVWLGEQPDRDYP